MWWRPYKRPKFAPFVAATILTVLNYNQTTMTTLDKFKISVLSWNGDEAPEKYVSLLDEQTSSLVRATADGTPLEDFYCTKVGKLLMQQVTVPSYLVNDPDFDGVAPFGFTETEAAPSEESAETDDMSFTVQSATSGLTGNTANSLQATGTKYMDLPEASRQLDALLYNILIMNVKGTKNSILQCMALPSYVQARIVLHKHMALSASHMKTQAFSRMDRLDYNSDPHSFEVQAISAY